MSSPQGFSSGALTTNGVVKSSNGLLTYAEAVGGTATLYEGSTSGKLLATITSSNHVAFTAPVAFSSTGLYITISAGSATVHTG
ncbi:MAG: hypothetical protein PVI03_07355 [Candidatus Thorarchaeota archaeon]|jgi:hypothetical protein